MSQGIDFLRRVYDKTDSGLDIITDLLPGIDDAVINRKRAFKLRPDERTASAHLYPPKDGSDCWHVKDYGMGEGGGFFSPIDLYMWVNGYSQSQFGMALQELAERYGVQEQLSASVNKPEVEVRAASAEEIGAMPSVTLAEGFGGIDLSCWGQGVKPEHLETYGWKAVGEVRIPKGDKVYVRRPTPTYPIFAQECSYVDEQGQPQTFCKVYEPKNPDKAHRFLIAGRKPKEYIYGLQAVRKAYEEGGEKKLDRLLLVSGGSDAMAALVKGYLAVWNDSEVKGLADRDCSLLMKYCNQLIAIPDIDGTGVKAGQQQALTHPGIHTAWMTPADMGGLHDNRGRERKDLRDFCHLHPSKKDFDQLINRAIRAKFWTENENADGRTEYVLSRTSLDYFLELNGFFTLEDESRKEPQYIRVEGCKVRRITPKAIGAFLKRWMQQQGLPQALQDKVLRSRDLPSNTTSTLRERDDLDFSRSTATSQRFCFRNAVVDVTAEKVARTPYSMLSDGKHVWEESIIQHDYKAFEPMFTAERTADGSYAVRFPDNPPSKLLRFLVNASRIYWRKEDEAGLELTDGEHAEEHLSLVSKMAAIGYLLHSYKSEAEAWAIICQDSTLSESDDECNGRSGKSFFLKAVSRMLRAFLLEARVPSVVDNRFLFDGVTEATDLIVVDECHKNLNFDYFFGKITGDLRYEEKGNHPRLIPFAQAPKFAFATNYVLRRHDPSTEGRMWPQTFSDYYHVQTKKNDYRETRTIRDDFGCNLMGSDYPEADWQADIAFMVQCVQFYLSLPSEERRIMPPMARIERREQAAAVGKDFKQWADDYFAEDSGNLDCDLKADHVLSDFRQETGFSWSAKSMTQHLRDYCQLADHIHCLNPVSITQRQKDGERWIKRDECGQLKTIYHVQSAKAAAEAAKTEPVQQNLPL